MALLFALLALAVGSYLLGVAVGRREAFIELARMAAEHAEEADE